MSNFTIEKFQNKTRTRYQEQCQVKAKQEKSWKESMAPFLHGLRQPGLQGGSAGHTGEVTEIASVGLSTFLSLNGLCSNP